MDIRPVSEKELVEAVRLVFRSLPPREAEARHLIDQAPARLGIDFRRMVVAVRNGRLLGACLYAPLDGRAALVLPPAAASNVATNLRGPLLESLIGSARGMCEAGGARLVQALLDEGPDHAVSRAYQHVGFQFLTVLEYFEADVTDAAPAPANRRYDTYRPDLEPLFTDVIRRSYAGSMDCPELDRVRSADDALAGHRSSGVFTPESWVLVYLDDAPAGLVLVNRVLGRDACELVYMGVAAEARGHGIGAWLVQKAKELTHAAGHHRLILAVDSRNVPARKLYVDAGFHKVNQRWAYYVPAP